MIDSIHQSSFLNQIASKLKHQPKRIVFADSSDHNVLLVAQELADQEIIVPILVGNRAAIKQTYHELGIIKHPFVGIVQPDEAESLPLFVNRTNKVRQYLNKQPLVDAENVLAKPINFASLMVQYGYADGLVAGSSIDSYSVYYAARKYIAPMMKGRGEKAPLFTIDIIEDTTKNMLDKERLLFLADCAYNADPSSDLLAHIALETGKLAAVLLDRKCLVAMLSHSHKGSFQSNSAEKVKIATSMVKATIKSSYQKEIQVIGEVSLDAAMNPQGSQLKLHNSTIEKRADVLVFPNLDAGHITTKVLQCMANLPNYGHLLLGLRKPVIQVPLGSSAQIIMGSSIILAGEAIKHNLIYLDK